MTYLPTRSLFDLRGKTALVTGAARGIGRAIALRLADAGANIVGCDINDEVRQTIRDIESTGGQGLPVRGNISHAAEVTRIVDIAVEKFGGIDVLVNNAALRSFTGWDSLTEADWDRYMSVNLKAVFFLSQSVAKRMILQGRGGAIVNIASTAALVPVRGKVDYNAAKAAVVMLTKSLAVELGPHRIRVNAVGPGGTNTSGPGANATAGFTPEQLRKASEAWFSRVPLPVGAANPDDIARVVLFFASEAASYVTGQTLYADAGYTVG